MKYNFIPRLLTPTDSPVQQRQSPLLTWGTKLSLGDDIEASFTNHGPPFLSTRLLDSVWVDRCNGGAAASLPYCKGER